MVFFRVLAVLVLSTVSLCGAADARRFALPGSSVSMSMPQEEQVEYCIYNPNNAAEFSAYEVTQDRWIKHNYVHVVMVQGNRKMVVKVPIHLCTKVQDLDDKTLTCYITPLDCISNAKNLTNSDQLVKDFECPFYIYASTNNDGKKVFYYIRQTSIDRGLCSHTFSHVLGLFSNQNGKIRPLHMVRNESTGEYVYPSAQPALEASSVNAGFIDPAIVSVQPGQQVQSDNLIKAQQLIQQAQEKLKEETLNAQQRAAKKAQQDKERAEKAAIEAAEKAAIEAAEKERIEQARLEEERKQEAAAQKAAQEQAAKEKVIADKAAREVAKQQEREAVRAQKAADAERKRQEAAEAAQKAKEAALRAEQQRIADQQKAAADAAEKARKAQLDRDKKAAAAARKKEKALPPLFDFPANTQAVVVEPTQQVAVPATKTQVDTSAVQQELNAAYEAGDLVACAALFKTARWKKSGLPVPPRILLLQGCFDPANKLYWNKLADQETESIEKKVAELLLAVREDRSKDIEKVRLAEKIQTLPFWQQFVIKEALYYELIKKDPMRLRSDELSPNLDLLIMPEAWQQQVRALVEQNKRKEVEIRQQQEREAQQYTNRIQELQKQNELLRQQEQKTLFKQAKDRIEAGLATLPFDSNRKLYAQDMLQQLDVQAEGIDREKLKELRKTIESYEEKLRQIVCPYVNELAVDMDFMVIQYALNVAKQRSKDKDFALFLGKIIDTQTKIFEQLFKAKIKQCCDEMAESENRVDIALRYMAQFSYNKAAADDRLPNVIFEKSHRRNQLELLFTTVERSHVPYAETVLPELERIEDKACNFFVTLAGWETLATKHTFAQQVYKKLRGDDQHYKSFIKYVCDNLASCLEKQTQAGINSVAAQVEAHQQKTRDSSLPVASSSATVSLPAASTGSYIISDSSLTRPAPESAWRLALDAITSISALTEDHFKNLMSLIFSGQDLDVIVDRLEALLLKVDKNDTQKNIQETARFMQNVKAHLASPLLDDNKALYAVAKQMFDVYLEIRNNIALYGRNETFGKDKRTIVPDFTTSKESIIAAIDSAPITESKKQKLREMLEDEHSRKESSSSSTVSSSSSFSSPVASSSATVSSSASCAAVSLDALPTLQLATEE